MKRIVMALLVAGGCATAPPANPNTLRASQRSIQMPPPRPSPGASTVYAQANNTLMSRQGLSTEAISAADARALNDLNRVLAIQPDYMDALNDKAWILATTPDPTLRQPQTALDMAKQALDSLARTGMLRANREAFADDHTTGRMLVAATTYATALAANGIFATSDAGPNAQRLAAAGCFADAESVMAFVVEAAANQDSKFHTPSTAEMVRRARDYQASFQQRKPLIGALPLFSLLSPATRLR